MKMIYPLLYSDYHLKHETLAMMKEMVEKINEIVNTIQLMQIEKVASEKKIEGARKK